MKISVNKSLIKFSLNVNRKNANPLAATLWISPRFIPGSSKTSYFILALTYNLKKGATLVNNF